MAQSYTRQSTFSDGDTITASLFNNEYNQLVNTFSYSAISSASTGHRHDGTAGEGGNIFKIGDLDFLNKIEVDSTNNRWGFYVEVASAAVEQIRIQDGAIVPVTDNDIDLGTASLEFKDLYIDGTANLDSLVLGSGSTVTSILDEDDLTSNSATALATQQSIKAYVDAQVTAQDFDFSADTGGALSIDLDSESMTFTGGTGIDTSGLGNAVTFAIDSTVATLTGSQTLTNKTLTSPDINGGTVDGATIATSDITVGAGKTLDVSAGTLTLADNQISGDKVEGGTIAATTITDLTFGSLNDGVITVTAFVDEDNMVSNSATLVPTQQSVKAYVDSQVTAQDLDFQADTGGALSIDLDSESLTFTGGTGIDTSGLGNAVTFAIDSTVATLTGTQTLSNKTLATPVVSGNLTTDGLIDGRDVATDGTKLDGIESGATADQTAAEIKTAYESNANTNAFTDADESKLDGIEALADVTDTANVTAAGALMDSELTSEASVKALNQGVATTDSPTFAGVTAPVTGDVTGNVTGNLTGSVLTAAQTNITSVGTLGSLTVSGDVTVDTNTLKVDSTNNRVGVLNATPDVSLDIGSATDAVHVPTGTTAERPTGAAGYFRYNTSLEQFEGYTTEWGSIGGGGGTNTFTTDSFTGDGTTVAYALSQTVSSENNLLVFIEGVFQQQDAYSIATAGGTTTLTFSAAPANGNSILIYSVAAAVSGSNLNIDSMTGDGSTVALTLTIAPVNENNTQVFIDGVYQNKSTYSISGTTLTFSTAPPNGSAVEVMTMTQTDINVPVDGTITPAKIASGDFYFDTDTLYVDATNNRVGIGTASPADLLHIKSTSADAEITLESTFTGGDARLRMIANSSGISSIQFQDEGDSNIGFLNYDHSDNSMQFRTNDAERMRIDSTGNLSINNSLKTPNEIFLFSYSGGSSGQVRSGIYLEGTDNRLSFYTSQNERMRIDSSGNLLVGTTVANGTLAVSSSGAAYTGYFNGTSGGQNIACRSGVTSGTAIRFLNSSGTDVGSIDTSGSATSYTTSSDYRLKENVVAMSGATERIKQLKPSRFNFITDPDTTVDGFLAHEVQDIVPEAITGAKDAVDAEGNPKYQGIDQSKLVPLLVATIQELEARITQLENN